MVIDASAIVAILLREPLQPVLVRAIAAAPSVAIGAPTLFEAAFVASSRLQYDVQPTLREFVRDVRAAVVPFTAEHFEVATDAFLRYGKGRHPAALNFGDCLSYAVAKVASAPLLYIGDDFAKTDIAAARY
jgi:ribonuclease VapC